NSSKKLSKREKFPYYYNHGFIDYYIYHDDNHGPYKKLAVKKGDATSQTAADISIEGDIVSLIVPLTPLVNLQFNDIPKIISKVETEFLLRSRSDYFNLINDESAPETFARTFESNPVQALDYLLSQIKKDIETSDKIDKISIDIKGLSGFLEHQTIRYYLCSAADYKRGIIKDEYLSEDIKLWIVTASFPPMIWVAELSIPKLIRKNLLVGQIVLDASSDGIDQQSPIISVHFWDKYYFYSRDTNSIKEYNFSKKIRSLFHRDSL
ncbi:MAG: hypothetical protein COB67_12965, partial [SAR324 cluster bacterium]